MPTMPFIPPVPRSADNVQRLQQLRPSVHSATNLNPQQNGKTTAFAASASLNHRQAEIMQHLQAQNFSPNIMTRLVELGHLRQDQFAHVVLIAEAMRQNEPLFERFAKTLRTISARGQNVNEGIKSLLAGVDTALDADLEKVMQTIHEGIDPQAKKELPLPVNTRTANPESKNNTGQNQGILPNNYHDIQAEQEKMASTLSHLTTAPFLKQARILSDKLLQTGPQSPRQHLQEFIELAETSLDEFPQRFTADLFAFSQLNKKGLPLDQYLRLSAELPSLRLLNAAIQAEKNHHTPQSLFQSLVAAQNQSLPLADQLTHLEQQWQVRMPSPQNEKAASAEAGVISMRQGEAKILDFVALDARDGLVADKQTSFIVLPQRQEYQGPTLNLSQLPPGVYMILAKAVNSENEIISKWMKVVIEPDEERKKQEQKKNHQKNGEGDEDDEKPEKIYVSSADPLAVDISGAPLIPLGPFLGEITLPLDYLHKNPSDMIIMGSAQGIIVSRDEFMSGNFSNNAVTFRFLAEYADIPNAKTRHALIKLKPNEIFERFDADLRVFLASPQAGLDNWIGRLSDFFDNLTSIFPSGVQTFSVAREMFARESTAFAQNNVNQSTFQNFSEEKDKKGFISACYAKGGYAMACAGIAGGSLHALSYATLCDPGNAKPEAALGQYLDELRSIDYSPNKSGDVQNMYGIHLSHSFGTPLHVNPAYAGKGRNFIEAVNISSPFDSQNSKPANPLLKAYGK